MASFIDFGKTTTPTNPDTDRVRLFLNSNGNLCIIKSDGSVIIIDEYFDKFIDMTDTPNAYGSAGEVVTINASADGIDFLTAGDGFLANFGTGHNDIARGDHDHDSRYYTKTEINSAYYTKTNLQTEGESQIDFANLTNVPNDITDLSTHSATELNDIDTVGSKNIITLDERTKLVGIEAGAQVNNLTDQQATDLTDGGVTTLHTHQYISPQKSIDYTSISKSGLDTQGYSVTFDSSSVYNIYKNGSLNVVYFYINFSTGYDGSTLIPYIILQLNDIAGINAKYGIINFVRYKDNTGVNNYEIINAENIGNSPLALKFYFNDNTKGFHNGNATPAIIEGIITLM